MSIKITLLLIFGCSLQFNLMSAAPVDWDIINFAITNPVQSNPVFVQNAALNILAEYEGIAIPPAVTAIITTALTNVAGPSTNALNQPQPVGPTPVFKLFQKHHKQPAPDCGPNKIGEFLVSVPCPKATPKPPREIVVKLPCPTTKKPEEPQCNNCQSCSCNSCNCKSTKPPKTTTKKPRKTTTTKKPCKHTEKPCDCESDSSSGSYEYISVEN